MMYDPESFRYHFKKLEIHKAEINEKGELRKKRD